MLPETYTLLDLAFKLNVLFYIKLNIALIKIYSDLRLMP